MKSPLGFICHLLFSVGDFISLFPEVGKVWAGRGNQRPVGIWVKGEVWVRDMRQAQGSTDTVSCYYQDIAAACQVLGLAAAIGGYRPWCLATATFPGWRWQSKLTQLGKGAQGSQILARPCPAPHSYPASVSASTTQQSSIPCCLLKTCKL